MPRGIGYGNKARGRGRSRGGQMMRLPGGNLPKQGQMPKGMPPKGKMPPARGKGRGKGMALGGAAMPGPGGAQLMRRVQSGKIDMDQAKKTMMQRQTLQKAFGKDWRVKVFGDRGYAQRTRTALAKSPKDPTLAALNKKLMERRKKMLTVAREKNKGDK